MESQYRYVYCNIIFGKCEATVRLYLYKLLNRQIFTIGSTQVLLHSMLKHIPPGYECRRKIKSASISASPTEQNSSSFTSKPKREKQIKQINESCRQARSKFKDTYCFSMGTKSSTKWQFSLNL